MYFDDSHITDRAVHGPSAQWSFGVLNDLLGTPFAEEKRQGAADLSKIHTHGRARFWVRERLEQKVLTFMRDARKSGKFTPGQAAKLYGMVNFLEHGLFGRIGLGEIQALKEHQYGALAEPAPASCRPSMCWRPSSVCAPGGSWWFYPWMCRGWWLPRTRPWRRIPLGLPGRWRFVAVISLQVYDMWGPGDHKIAQLELFMVAHALTARPDQFCGRRGVWFIDNIASLMCLIRGRSDNPDLAKMATYIQCLLFALRASLYWEYIPSKSIGPTRSADLGPVTHGTGPTTSS